MNSTLPYEARWGFIGADLQVVESHDKRNCACHLKSNRLSLECPVTYFMSYFFPKSVQWIPKLTRRDSLGVYYVLYLYSRFDEVQPHRQSFSHEDVGVVGSFESFLELFQLPAVEIGPRPPPFPLTATRGTRVVLAVRVAWKRKQKFIFCLKDLGSIDSLKFKLIKNLG
ncbi:hypothetical protein AVEN_133752-1, partial [Araneus ventricosus]